MKEIRQVMAEQPDTCPFAAEGMPCLRVLVHFMYSAPHCAPCSAPGAAKDAQLFTEVNRMQRLKMMFINGALQFADLQILHLVKAFTMEEFYCLRSTLSSLPLSSCCLLCVPCLSDAFAVTVKRVTCFWH